MTNKRCLFSSGREFSVREQGSWHKRFHDLLEYLAYRFSIWAFEDAHYVAVAGDDDGIIHISTDGHGPLTGSQSKIAFLQGLAQSLDVSVGVGAGYYDVQGLMLDYWHQASVVFLIPSSLRLFLAPLAHCGLLKTARRHIA